MKLLTNRSSSSGTPLKRSFRRLWKRYMVRRLWRRYLKWPVPLWRLRRYARLNWGGYRFKFCVVDQTVWWLRAVQGGKYENGVRNFLRDALKPGDIFFDIGAWTGPYSLLASKLVEPGGCVYSFEPDPVARSLLHRNLTANAVSNVAVFAYAITDQECLAGLDCPAGYGVSKVSQGRGAHPVQTVSLSSFCKKYSVHPSVIKIDVEGCEARVFAGGAQEIEQSRATIVEIHEDELREIGDDPSVFVQSVFSSGKQVLALDQWNRNGEGPEPGTELTREDAGALRGAFTVALVRRSDSEITR